MYRSPHLRDLICAADTTAQFRLIDRFAHLFERRIDRRQSRKLRDSTAADHKAPSRAPLGYSERNVETASKSADCASRDMDRGWRRPLRPVWVWLFSNSGSSCQTLRSHPCRGHGPLRDRRAPFARWRRLSLVDEYLDRVRCVASQNQERSHKSTLQIGKVADRCP